MDKRFTVRWEIDIWSDSHRHAAEQARAIQLDPENDATVFEVREILDFNNVDVRVIDLHAGTRP